MEDNLDFYKNMAKIKLPLAALLKNEYLFSDVPPNWTIIVTDVKNSTRAVSNGQHNDVNLSATGSIITVLNTLKTLNNKTKIPYFFGGDGSTFIVPNTVLKPILLALEDYSRHVNTTFQLQLRVGHMEVKKAYENKTTLRITKLKHNDFLTTPVVLGNGLKYAERIIKDKFIANNKYSKKDIEPNLEGMQCRWDEIYPNQTDKKVICLLVDCEDEKLQSEVYGIIMQEIDLIFGNLETRNPISSIKLKLNTSYARVKKEMYAKLGKFKLMYLVKNWGMTNFGVLYLKFSQAGKLYKNSVSQLSDTIMIDGFLNTVITGTETQISKLQTLLDDLEKNRKIIYGIHVTHASVMTCYIEDKEKKHIHFVDGTEGGYTSAAIMFKEKIRRMKRTL